MAENILPDGDVSLGGWTTQAGGVSNLYQAIDETTLNASDFIQSATNPVVDTYEFTFSNPSALLASGVLNIVAGKKLNNAAVVNLRVQLLQSTTLIAEWTISDLPYTPALSQFTLTAPQLAAITDPTLLRGKLIANPASTTVAAYAGSTASAWQPGSPYTVTGMSFPNAGTTRYCGIAVGNYMALEITGVTINGVSCGLKARAFAESSTNNKSDIWVTDTPVTTGTSHNVVITYGTGGPVSFTVHSFSLVDPGSPTPVSTDEYRGFTSPAAGGGTIPTGGLALALIEHESTAAITWTTGTSMSFQDEATGTTSSSLAQYSTAGAQTLGGTYAAGGVMAVAIWSPSTRAFEMTDIGSDLWAWFSSEGGTNMTLDGSSNVTQYTDRSTHGRHISPGSLAAPPYASNKITCLKSSGKGFAAWATALPGTAWDCYFVGDPDLADSAGFRTMLCQPAGNHNYLTLVASTAEMALYDGTGSVLRYPTLTWSGLSLRQAMSRVKTTTAVDMGINGGLTPSAVASISGIALSASPVVGNAISGFEGFGDIYEIVFTAPNLPDIYRRKIEGRQAWKWDGILGGSTLVTALPSGHPYKSAPP